MLEYPDSQPPQSAPLTSRRRTLGLLVDGLKELYQNAVFTAVANAASEYDVNLVCFAGGILDSPELFWSQRNLLYDFVGSHNLDGLIITAGTMGNLIGPDNLTRYLERYRPLPIVSTAYHLPDFPSIVVDNETGMRAVLEHLVVGHGHRRIAFVRGPSGNQEAQRRFAVYREVLKDHSLTYDPSLVYEGTFLRRSGIDAACWFIDHNIRFDSLVAANDLMALGALATFQSRGVRVPDSFAIAGFDDVEEARFSAPQLTTVRQPFRALGREAVRLALAQVEGIPVPDKISLPSQLVIRRSCGCLADGGENELLNGASIAPSASRTDVMRRFVSAFRSLEQEGVYIDERTVVGLFEALLLELEDEGPHAFTTWLTDLIRSQGGDDLAPWNQVVSIMYRTIAAWTATDPSRRARADRIQRQVRLSIGDIAEVVQGQQRLRLGAQAVELSETSKALTSTFEIDSLRQTLVEHIPRLHIPACFVSLYERPSSPLTSAQLQVAYDEHRPEVADAVGHRFDTPSLAPSGLLFGEQRCTYVIQSLFFERRQLGFAAFQMGPPEGLIYEALRDQISGALNGSLLMAQVVEEGKLRQIAEREQAEKEMRIAVQVQTMILPRAPQVARLELAALMLPAVNVGGDYYDILPAEDGCWIGIGDVAGRGLGSGLIMLMIQSAVTALVSREPNISPSDIVKSLNSVIFHNVHDRLRQSEHATFCVIRYRQNGSLVFAGAHEDILVYRARTRQCDLLSTSGIWLGLLPDIADATRDEFGHLEDGDVLLLYTDGIVEARDAHEKLYGHERLMAEFERVGGRPVAEICDHLVNCVRRWMSIQEDDMTLLVARYKRGPAAPIPLKVSPPPAEP